MATTHDYIPQDEGLFDDWQDNFITYVTGNLATWNILATDPLWLSVLKQQIWWVPAYAAGKKSVNPAHPQVVTKNDVKKTFKKAIRKFYKADIAYNPTVTNTDRSNMKTTIYDTTRTVPPVPTHAPVGFVQDIMVGAHELRVTDPETPDTKEFPIGLKVDLYRFIGTAVDKTSHFEQIATLNKADYEVVNDPANIGSTAFYYVQYENSRHEQSPKSAIFSAAIA